MEISLSIFRHRHHHVTIPNVEILYHEANTGNDWVIRAGVDTAYLLRWGELLKYDHGGEKFEAELVKRRLECSLLVGHSQYVEFQPEGFVLLTELDNGDFQATFALGSLDESESGKSTADWFSSLTAHTWLRRAVEDIHTAIKLEQENVVFLFRAFEWLQKGLNVPWKDLGPCVDVPQVNLKRLKKEANNWNAGARHAVDSGKKIRFGEKELGSWI